MRNPPSSVLPSWTQQKARASGTARGLVITLLFLMGCKILNAGEEPPAFPSETRLQKGMIVRFDPNPPMVAPVEGCLSSNGAFFINACGCEVSLSGLTIDQAALVVAEKFRAKLRDEEQEMRAAKIAEARLAPFDADVNRLKVTGKILAGGPSIIIYKGPAGRRILKWAPGLKLSAVIRECEMLRSWRFCEIFRSEAIDPSLKGANNSDIYGVTHLAANPRAFIGYGWRRNRRQIWTSKRAISSRFSMILSLLQRTMSSLRRITVRPAELLLHNSAGGILRWPKKAHGDSRSQFYA
jgi:hypothetical protein